MVDICWSEKGGWHRPRVQAYGPISLDPAAAVLHYAQEVFEGLKAYRHADGSIWSFRPDQNAARMQRSARRLALPELPTEYFIESLKQLIAVDARLGADAGRGRLYLRPFMFAKEAFLGVRPAAKVNYYLIASPAGAYFSGGITPLEIWLSTQVHARRPRRHGPGEDRRQLRVVARRAGRGLRERLPAGAVPRRRRGQVPRRARRHERRARHQRQAAHHARQRLDPRRHHARVDPAARDRPRLHGRAAPRLARRVARRRRIRRHRRGVRVRHRRRHHPDRRAAQRRRSRSGCRTSPTPTASRCRCAKS